ncbi:hypothetical protein D3C87_1482640 [compost metagenome]
MTSPGDHAHLFTLIEQLDVQVLTVALVRQAPQHHIEIAAQQGRQQGIAGTHLNGNPHLGVIALVRQHRFGQQPGHRPHHAADAHPSHGPALQFRDLRLGLLELMQRALGVTDHHLTIKRWLHAARQALEQTHSKTLFQLLQQQAGGRLRGVHRRSRPAQVAELTQGMKQGDLPAGNFQGAEIIRRERGDFWAGRHIKSGIPA